MILSCQNIEKAFLEKQVLKNCSFHIEEHEKAAIVGINGAGKTTLLRIIVGELEADAGSVTFSRDVSFGYLSQNAAVNTENTIYEELLSVKKHLLELEEQIRREILDPTLKGFQEDGLDFKGVLFIGLMISKDGPKVIEFNNRFGDPETQSVLARLETDLFDIMTAVVENRLSRQEIRWSDRRAVCVVLASGGYPGSYEKGKPISGLADVEPDITVFHAGTRLAEDGLTVLTDGGRVLGVTATGATHQEAREKAFANAKRIHFEGMQYRKDIGLVRGL